MPTPDFAPAAAAADRPRRAPAGGAAGWERAGYLWLRRLRDRLLGPVAAPLAVLAVPPWAVSCAGPVFAATVLWTLPEHPRLALAGFLLALACDAADGALARRLGRGSGRGKLIDHGCDAVTLAAVLAAAARAGWVSPRLAAGALALILLPLGLALARRAAESGSWSADPRGGLFAHLPKLPVYGGLTVQLLGGPALVAPAVVLGSALGALSGAGFALALVRPRRRAS